MSFSFGYFKYKIKGVGDKLLKGTIKGGGGIK